MSKFATFIYSSNFPQSYVLYLYLVLSKSLKKLYEFAFIWQKDIFYIYIMENNEIFQRNESNLFFLKYGLWEFVNIKAENYLSKA